MRVFIVVSILTLFACSSQKEKNQLKESSQKKTVSIGGAQVSAVQVGMPKLSDYNFFKGELKDLTPVEDVYPYDLNSPLFSDYAYKARFVKIPADKKAYYNSEEVLDFPIGTILIKNFYYPADFRKPEGKRTIIETRLLIREEKEWKALPYIWNNEQTDAFLEVAGGVKKISWKDKEGINKQLSYSIPNMNQCRSCHLKNNKITPIGPSARQLNKDYAYGEKTTNQLDFWKEHEILANLPESGIPELVNYQNERLPIADRARAYLEINCGHCHRPDGPAKNSALHLMADVKNEAAWGVGKTPIAAGKGSGGFKYDIVKGNPEESILVYRMASTDPGIMMPELGRKMVHEEGLALVKDWIREME